MSVGKKRMKDRKRGEEGSMIIIMIIMEMGQRRMEDKIEMKFDGGEENDRAIRECETENERNDEEDEEEVVKEVEEIKIHIQREDSLL